MSSTKYERLYGEQQRKNRRRSQTPSAVEGGFINDRSGQATKRLRRQLKIGKRGVDF
mgnify:CR=1 FL=1